MFENGLEMFFKDTGGKPEDTVILFEITIANLKASGDIDKRDFLTG